MQQPAIDMKRNLVLAGAQSAMSRIQLTVRLARNSTSNMAECHYTWQKKQ